MAGQCKCKHPGDCLKKIEESIKQTSNPILPLKKPEPSNVDVGSILATYKEAGVLYKDKKYVASGKKVEEAQSQLATLVLGTESKKISPEELKDIQGRIEKAHKALASQGVTVEPVVIISRQVYEKFLIDYSAFVTKYEEVRMKYNKLNSWHEDYKKWYKSTHNTDGQGVKTYSTQGNTSCSSCSGSSCSSCGR